MDYQTIARSEVIDWLLEPENPSIRYWALQHFQNKPPTHPDVISAQEAIPQSSLVQAFLKAQAPDGYWGMPTHIYAHKYKATSHTLLILAELGTPRIPVLEKAIEHLFTFQLDSGHFTTALPKTPRGYASQVSDTCCLDANILFSLTHFGYLLDARTQKTVQFLIDHFNADAGGWKCRAYPINPDAVFPSMCYMGLCKVLKCFSTIPKQHRTPPILRILDRVVEVVLENHVFKYLQNPDGSRKEKLGWKRFGFPLFYNSDILDVLASLARLQVKDDRVQDAISVVIDAQQSDGKWILKHTFNGKFWHDIEQKGKPSKWITLRALYVLKHFVDG